MQQTVKVVVVLVLVITCVSLTSYLCYVYYSRNSYLLDDYNHNYETISTVQKLAHNFNQMDNLQGDYITYTPRTPRSKHLRKVTKNKVPTQAPHSLDPVSTDVHIMPIPDKESKGYILPYSIWEEQTSGANNLWQLQIWAKNVGMYVVEPFARDSYFTMRRIIPNFNQALRFGDYFDKEEWNRMVMRTGGNPLVTWEEFITDFPRDAIILYTVREENRNPPLSITYDENVTVCSEGRISRRDMLWIKKTFNVVKTVCYICATNLQHALPLEKFNSAIFYDNGLKPNQVTLIIVNWIGIQTVRVHLMPLTKFIQPLKRKISFPPSKRVMTAYKAYMHQYIGNHKYVGIVFRTHHVMDFSPLPGSFANQSKYLLECSKNLSKVLDKVRGKWKIFLAYDMGMFGSRLYATRNNLTSLQEQIFLDVFNGSLQVNEREKNLRNAANGTTDRGLIAQLEKVIAANADCIVLLGPVSTFVKSSSFMYISQHPTKMCIVSICADKVYDLRKLISSDTIPNNFIND